ncbi:hypothetical protein LCGC14_1031650 [marine sediment metagenome]|uniref:Uncharacterized protein n=1 Tax=marine sediment metagenome TaxID=412755 RepID=A0A0F9QCI5_9ZZZZ
MTAEELREKLVARCRAIDDELRGREHIMRKAAEEHHAVIETLRKQYDAFSYLIPMLDDILGRDDGS